MNFWVDIAAALWLGILTSLSPCPLATNIAAISYVGNRVGSSRRILGAGLLYTIGRMLSYIVVGFIVTNSLLSIPTVSMFLQKYMNMFLGPVLILTSIILFNFVKLTFSTNFVNDRIQNRIQKSGIWGAGLLGILFALSFCPISAALFFGNLIPLAIKHSSRFVVPSLYAIGTAVPVIIFAVLMTVSFHTIGKLFSKLTIVELWIRRVMALIFLFTGIYLTLVHTFKLSLF